MTVQGHGWDDNVGAPAFRNVIINGSMSVAQRGTSVTGNTAGGYLTADRWTAFISSLGTWTQTIENDAPTGSGLTKSIKMLCTTASSSPAAASYCQLSQPIEGQNLQHFANGTSSAKKYTLSFWVKSNVTGTYIAELSASNGRAVSLSYTISASGVWEKKTIVFPADTVSSIVNDNTVGIYVVLNLAAGSNYTSGTLQTTWATTVSANRYVGQVNLASAINNYWQVTGVQLESGSVATPFEFEPFETTLRKCMRYYEVSQSNELGALNWSGSNDAAAWIPFLVAKRGTVTLSGGGSYNGGVAGTFTFPTNSYNASTKGFSITMNVAASSGKASVYYGLNWTASSEL